MLISCRSLFMGETDRLPLATELDFSAMEFQGIYPFRTPVRITGEITARAGVVRLTATASFRFDGRCDRCLGEFSRDYEVTMDHVLVTALENEDSDLILLEEYQLPLDDLVQMDMLLELPYKSLCREDCSGLCPQCGKNLNEGPCGCRRETADPRWNVLGQLLN